MTHLVQVFKRDTETVPIKFLRALIIFIALLLVPCSPIPSTVCLAKESPGRPNIYSLSQKQELIAAIGAYGIPAYAMVGGKSYRGTYISHIVRDGLAAQAGIKVGDVLLNIDNKVTDFPSTTNKIAFNVSGKDIRITLARPRGKQLLVESLRTTWNTSAASFVPSGSSGGSAKHHALPPVTELESYMLELVNKDRKTEGLGAVRRSQKLTELARAHAEDMAKRGYFNHQSPEGRYANHRASMAGLRCHIAENIAWAKSGEKMPKELIQVSEDSMMSEPPGQMNHRGTILDPVSVCVGIGVAYDASEKILSVQVFSHDEIP